MTSTISFAEVTVDEPAVVPGVVTPGTCWTLRKIGSGRASQWHHYPTWERANAAVTIDPDDPSDSYDVLSEIECELDECLRERRLAEVAYREHQARIEAGRVAAERERLRAEAGHRDQMLEAALDKNAAEREHQQRLQQIEGDYRVCQMQAQTDEAAYRAKRLELLADEADFRERQIQVLADAAADQTATQLAWRLVDAAQTEIGKADTKAGLVVTLELALIAAAGSGVLGAAGPLRWAAIAAMLGGVLAAAWAVLPRMPRRTAGGGTRLNYGAVRGLVGDELAGRVRRVAELEAASAEAVALARIVHAKYVWIRWAMLAGVVGLVLAVITTGIGAAS